MNTTNFVSITDLRQSATKIITWLKKTWDQIIFINNKPSAVLISYEEYQEMTEWPIELYSFAYDDLSEADKKLVEEVKQMPDDAFVNI